MKVYYLFIGQEFYAYIMVRTGSKLSRFNHKQIESFKTLESARVYTCNVEY